MLFGQTLVLDSLGIEGLKKTKEIYLRKLIQTEVGKPLDSLKMTEDITRIIRIKFKNEFRNRVIFNKNTPISPL